ncbi:MAG: Methylmalonate semialdehyde dehydrogenase [acylating] [Candidatus Heimdallarchaeota archaeon LC_3]|nr:MAG: Methylmalonate semialdehyde dehydrogenase [acylating] [Candidatus Heimdallarchaeota archaeon LC_3]
MTKKLKNFIDGEWVDSETTKFTDVLNPATQEVIAECPESTRSDVNQAVKAASEAYVEWRQTPVLSRTRYLHEYKNLIEENFEDISKIVVMEAGKTIDEARGEVRRAIESIEFAFGVPSLMTGFKIEDISSGIDETAERQPLGVFAALTPFNFPFMVPLWFLPTAIACGNTYIIKPSPQVPLSMEIAFDLLKETDLPNGVVSLVNGGVEAANALIEHPDVKGISFVGSSKVGKLIYENSSKHGKRVQIQGGAKNYMVVMPDANLKGSVANILGSAYGCAGQRCLAGSVLVAVGDVLNPLTEELVKQAKNMRVGYGLDESSQVGTVISKASVDRIKGMIEKGISEGAKLELDGRDVSVKGYEKGNFIGPTIFTNVKKDMQIAREEIFGPVLSILHVPTFDEAIKAVNSSQYGNAASIFTSSGGHAREFKYKVEAGNIGINIGVAAPNAYFPFGGKKKSFYGDTHGQGPDSIHFFTDHKVVIERWI